MKDWSLWCGKIIELGKVEATSRHLLKNCWNPYKGSIDMAKPDGKHAQHMKICYHVRGVDAYDVACLELLSQLLYPPTAIPSWISQGIHFHQAFRGTVLSLQ